MNTIDKMLQSFGSQDIGYIFIVLIMLAMVISIYYSIKIGKIYTGLLNDFQKSPNKLHENDVINGERYIENKELNTIIKEFEDSAKRGTENINTEVIIQKGIGKKISGYERILKLLPSLCIASGLLGTFLGLTLAIISTQAVIGGIESMDAFAEAMKGPFNSMSSAFWTSIFGVGASLVINFINAIVENKKENFYDEIEDYLDNVIYGLYAKNFTSQFSEFNTTIKESMLGLAKNMKSLFEEGVKELVGNINKSNLDLTDTVKGLSNYTKDLDRLTKSLNTSVENFKQPVDIFKQSIHEFTVIEEELSTNIKESINKFSNKVDLLDSSLGGLYESIDSNRREIAGIGSILKLESHNLNCSYEQIANLINSISKIQIDNNLELQSQITKLNKGYENFDSGLIEFINSLRVLQSEISSGISNTLEREMTSLTNNIVDKLEISLKEVNSSSEQLTRNTLSIGELVKATNELYATTIIKKGGVSIKG